MKSVRDLTLCLAGLAACVAFGSFRLPADENRMRLAADAQTKLTAMHSAAVLALKLRKSEITVTEDGFLRYRRTYPNGKQEYYSLNVMRLKSLDYLGTTAGGNLTIRTLEDDVIVQTYNDRSGNVDSMSVQLNLAVNSVEPEDLHTLQNDLLELGRSLNAN